MYVVCKIKKKKFKGLGIILGVMDFYQVAKSEESVSQLLNHNLFTRILKLRLKSDQGILL